MREMTDDEMALFEIIKNDTELSNYEIVRRLYSRRYGIELPKINGDLPSIWTIERQIRLLKQTYPSLLTNSKERQIKADMEVKYKDMATDQNKPIKPQTSEQSSLGLFGENEWW